MITAAQLRAARGLLDWTRSDLAKAANISPETIKNIEHGTFRPQENTAEAIVKAFAAQDVEFSENEGVRRIRDSVVRLEGSEGFKSFMDDVYEVAQQSVSKDGSEKPICISYVDDRLFMKNLGDYLNVHIHRMNAIKDLKTRILIEDKPYSYSSEERQGSSYREYRQNANKSDGKVPFYVYGDKLAILILDEVKPPKIVVISSSLIAKAYRDQFEIMWASAKPLAKL